MFAERLKQGDVIGIVAPSHVATRERYAPIIRGIEQAGFRVREGKNLYSAAYGYSATEAERAADFREMALDPMVKLVFFGGGEGGNELLPLLDFDAIRAHPKLYLSYSDGTDLLNAIYFHTGIATLYGQTPGLFDGISEYDRAQFFAHLCGYPERHTGNSAWQPICPGRAEGVLVGGYLGNLALMLAGEHFAWRAGGPYVLFAEDCEAFRGVDGVSALLARLEQHPFMDRVAGLVFGHFADDPPAALYERLARLGKAHGIPVACCDDYGHGKNHAILPIGARAQLDAEHGLSYFYE